MHRRKDQKYSGYKGFQDTENVLPGNELELRKQLPEKKALFFFGKSWFREKFYQQTRKKIQKQLKTGESTGNKEM